MGELYRLDFSSGKSYIGVTRKTSERRYEEHAKSAFKGGRYAIHRAWRKFGSPRLAKLALVENHMLMDSEAKAVRVFGTLIPSGYNMLPGGFFSPLHARLGKKHSDEAKAKMSDAAKRRPPASSEAREKMSIAKFGKKKTAETRARMSLAQRGRIITPEHRAKIAAAKLGVRATEETRAKLSRIRMGHVVSATTCRKISEALKGNTNTRGKKFTDEHKAKIAAALMGNNNGAGNRRAIQQSQAVYQGGAHDGGS